jgi:hypothetical protein
VDTKAACVKLLVVNKQAYAQPPPLASATVPGLLFLPFGRSGRCLLAFGSFDAGARSPARDTPLPKDQANSKESKPGTVSAALPVTGN